MNANPFLDFCAPGIAGLNPYVPGKPVTELERELGIRDSVKLASNENPLGPSARVVAALPELLPELSRYPDGGGFQLRHALADWHQLESVCVTLGNGSNDVLDLIARCFLSPGVEAVFSQYAFAVYGICTQAVGALSMIAPAHDGSRGPAYGHDLEAMQRLVSDRTRVVFIANPNNPTGTWVPGGELQAFIESLPPHVMVVVDEAYFEYVDEADYPDTSNWLGRFPNLIVTRTFSKAYGLAGLRIGYGLSDPKIAELLNRVRQPFNVNTLGQAAACIALQDQQHIERSVAVNREGMRQLVDGIQGLGLDCIPSVGNSLAVNMGRPAAAIDHSLLRHGCIVRPLDGYGMPDYLRVTVGLAEENRRFLDALSRVLP